MATVCLEKRLFGGQRGQQVLAVPFVRLVARVHDQEADCVHAHRQVHERLVQKALRGTAGERARISLYFGTPHGDPFGVPEPPPRAHGTEGLDHLVVRIVVVVGASARPRTDRQARRLVHRAVDGGRGAVAVRAMLIGHPRLRGDAVRLLRNRPRHGRYAVEGELLPAVKQRRVLRHRRVQRLARPASFRLGVECRDASRAPAADPPILHLVPRGSRRMARDAQVVVDPHAARAEGGIEPRHLAHILQEALLPRTVAGLVLQAPPPGEAAPGLPVGALDGSRRVGMPQRRLDLQARHDADGAQLFGIADKPLHVRLVPRHLREPNSRREPHLVACAAVLAQDLERLGPLRVVRSVRSPQAYHHQRRVPLRRNDVGNRMGRSHENRAAKCGPCHPMSHLHVGIWYD